MHCDMTRGAHVWKGGGICMTKNKKPKAPLKSKTLTGDSISRAEQSMHPATEREVGDTADEITRAPKRKR